MPELSLAAQMKINKPKKSEEPVHKTTVPVIPAPSKVLPSMTKITSSKQDNILTKITSCSPQSFTLMSHHQKSLEEFVQQMSGNSSKKVTASMIIRALIEVCADDPNLQHKVGQLIANQNAVWGGKRKQN